MEQGFGLIPITEEEMAAFESMNHSPAQTSTPSIRVSNASITPPIISPPKPAAHQSRGIIKPSQSIPIPSMPSPSSVMRIVEKEKEKEKEYDEEISRDLIPRRPMEIDQHRGGGRMEVSISRSNRMMPYGAISSSPSFEILVSQERLSEIMDFLRRDVDPSDISYRPGPGGAQLAYIEGVIVEDIANELFTPFGWSHEVKNIGVTSKQVTKDKYEATCHCIVRVTVHVLGNVFKEDTGSGIVSGREEGVCQENARKGAITDAIKRALKHFGRGLGGSLYHKPTIAKYKEIKGKGK